MAAKHLVTSLIATLASVVSASAQVRITEWQYNGTEFVELTNLGSTPTSLVGWSFDDDSRTPGVFSLSGLGTLNPGQSGIMAELAASAFRSAFPSMSASVPVVGGNLANLGREDEINIFDASNVLIDRLQFGDQTRGTIRTDINSGNPQSLAEAMLGGTDDVLADTWILSASGDRYSSFASTSGGFANPGIFTLVPEPTSFGILAAFVAPALRRRRALCVSPD